MRRTGMKALVAAGVVAAGVAASTTAVAASDIFLKLGTIHGESLDSKHKNEIDVMSWSWGASNGTAKLKKGVIPPACIQDLALTKALDSSSPAIITMGVTGQVVPDATLTMRRSGGDQQDFFILRLTNVSVPSYQTSASEGANLIMESVVLHFDSLKGEYRRQKEDGSLEAPVFFDVSGQCPQ